MTVVKLDQPTSYVCMTCKEKFPVFDAQSAGDQRNPLPLRISKLLLLAKVRFESRLSQVAFAILTKILLMVSMLRPSFRWSLATKVLALWRALDRE